MLKNRRHRYALVFLAMSTLAGSAALAALSVYMPPEQVAEQSPLIVEGTVSHVATGFNRSTGAIRHRSTSPLVGGTVAWSRC